MCGTVEMCVTGKGVRAAQALVGAAPPECSGYVCDWGRLIGRPALSPAWGHTRGPEGTRGNLRVHKANAGGERWPLACPSTCLCACLSIHRVGMVSTRQESTMVVSPGLGGRWL